MCVSKPKIPKPPPAPPPAAPMALPQLRSVTPEEMTTGSVDPGSGRRRRGLDALRINLTNPSGGLRTPAK